MAYLEESEQVVRLRAWVGVERVPERQRASTLVLVCDPERGGFYCITTGPKYFDARAYWRPIRAWQRWSSDARPAVLD